MYNSYVSLENNLSSQVLCTEKTVIYVCIGFGVNPLFFPPLQGSFVMSSKPPLVVAVLAKAKIERRRRERAQTAENLCQLKLITWTMCHAFQIR